MPLKHHPYGLAGAGWSCLTTELTHRHVVPVSGNRATASSPEERASSKLVASVLPARAPNFEGTLIPAPLPDTGTRASTQCNAKESRTRAPLTTVHGAALREETNLYKYEQQICTDMHRYDRLATIVSVQCSQRHSVFMVHIRGSTPGAHKAEAADAGIGLTVRVPPK